MAVAGTNRSELKERIYTTIAKSLGIDEDEITDDATFVGDLGCDSLDLVELVMDYEEDFGIEIDDDAADKIKTVKDAIDAISRRLNRK